MWPCNAPRVSSQPDQTCDAGSQPSSQCIQAVQIESNDFYLLYFVCLLTIHFRKDVGEPATTVRATGISVRLQPCVKDDRSKGGKVGGVGGHGTMLRKSDGLQLCLVNAVRRVVLVRCFDYAVETLVLKYDSLKFTFTFQVGSCQESRLPRCDEVHGMEQVSTGKLDGEGLLDKPGPSTEKTPQDQNCLPLRCRSLTTVTCRINNSIPFKACRNA
ncbi:hypothetical protein EVG20_g6822 [Dentipellis fragilis]|uniref:Uncharacterized protein n=1 Tax=Dentipellis fragilis TaxID=205917 RepID=A0A4Y9YIX4_9AGAM|nr:hypothetical protein EVG20_g6822 [Dentipellis fragilis]